MVFVKICVVDYCFSVSHDGRKLDVSKYIDLGRSTDSLDGEFIAWISSIYMAVKKDEKIRRLLEELLKELDRIAGEVSPWGRKPSQ